MPKGKLTPRQQKFVDAYAGNATDAARRAGYRGTDNTLAQTGSDLLRNPEVRAAIRRREDTERRTTIATRAERQAFWTSTLRDDGLDLRDRLKASELLGKSEADFTDRVEHSGNVTLEQLVVASLGRENAPPPRPVAPALESPPVEPIPPEEPEPEPEGAA